MNAPAKEQKKMVVFGYQHGCYHVHCATNEDAFRLVEEVANFTGGVFFGRDGKGEPFAFAMDKLEAVRIIDDQCDEIQKQREEIQSTLKTLVKSAEEAARAQAKQATEGEEWKQAADDGAE